MLWSSEGDIPGDMVPGEELVGRHQPSLPRVGEQVGDEWDKLAGTQVSRVLTILVLNSSILSSVLLGVETEM